MDSEARAALRAQLRGTFSHLTDADADKFIDLMVTVNELRSDRDVGEVDPK